MQKETAVKFLIRKGVRADLTGFKYLVTILEKVDKKNIFVYKITLLYKTLADLFNKTVPQVERAIRNARKLAGYSIPNREFIINLMVEYYDL